MTLLCGYASLHSFKLIEYTAPKVMLGGKDVTLQHTSVQEWMVGEAGCEWGRGQELYGNSLYFLLSLL
jgi:hypothetical protein